MKKLFICLLCLFMVCGAIACGNQGAQEEDLASIKVINASEEEIYGIGYSYYADGNLLSSGGGCNADNSAIKVGDTFALEEQSFFEDTKNLEIKLSVFNETGIEYECSTRIPVEVANGKVYEIEVIGDYKNGFKTSVIAFGKNDIYEIGITLSSDEIEVGGYQEELDYSGVVLSPTKDKVTIYATQSLGDGAVVLIPVGDKEENEYQRTYITPGMPVEFDVKKGVCYKIAVAKYNDTGVDKIAYVRVEGAEVRCE